MTRIGIFMMFLLMTFGAMAQKVISEGSIVYKVTVVSGKTEPGADVFDGATQTVWMKASQVRTDFQTALRLQSTFYDGKDASAVILKESGKEKYMIQLSPAQWLAYNKKYNGIQYQYLPDTKQVAGYNCKKATVTVKGSLMTVYYTPDLLPFTKGYDYQFKDVPGTVLEYEVKTGNIVVNYKASDVQMGPVNASRFDLPKAGYKILEYNQ